MNHHGELAKDILTTGLLITKGINNPNSIPFPASRIHGDRGYNNDECFELIEDAGRYGLLEYKKVWTFDGF